MMSEQNASPREEIVIADYPALKSLCWSYHARTIPALEALHKYEDGWFRVETDKLTGKERALIVHLTETVGNGCFLG